MKYLWLALLALLFGCATATKQPDGSVVKDPPQVSLSKNLKFWRGELDVAKGVVKALNDQHKLDDEKAAQYDKYITTAQTALGLASNGGDNYSCLKDMSCTDEQMAKINEGIGQAIVFIVTLKSGS